jgi:O-antigen ligase
LQFAFLVNYGRLAKVLGCSNFFGIQFALLFISQFVSLLHLYLVLDRQSIEDVNANFTAYILAGTCYLGICFYKLRWSSRWFGYTLILLNILTFIKIDFLGTRGALISLVAIWTWLIFYRFVSRRMTILMIFAAFGACILFTLGVFDDLLLYIDDLSNRGTGDLSGRLPVWQFAKQLISENPVWGIGIGSFEAVNPFGIGAHNIFLTFMLEMGSVGLLLFMVFLYSLFFPARNNGMLSYRKFLLGAFFCFWLPIAVSGHWELAPFSWLLLGVTFNLMRFSWENTVIA